MTSKSNEDGFSRSKKVGGWAQETHTPPKPKETITEKSPVSEKEIPTIPDIDELTESMAKENISIPNISINKNVTYQELDSELLKQNSFATLDDVNLSALLKFIHPDVNLKESDSIWTIETLFKDLGEIYQNECEDD